MVNVGTDAKIISEVAAAKQQLAELKELVNVAKEKQKAASAECKRLEKEMDDFKNNKDSKLKEIKVGPSVQCYLSSRAGGHCQQEKGSRQEDSASQEPSEGGSDG